MKQTLFIHVPRTAGWSMTKYAEEYSGSFQLADKSQKIQEDVLFVTTKHRIVDGLFDKKMSREFYDSCFKFAFVRNSWDRIVSCFHHYRSFRFRQQSRTVNFLSDFDTFVTEMTSGSKLIEPTRPLGDCFSHCRSQLVWLRLGVDFIGRFEDLDKDWEWLCCHIGLPYSPLEQHHKSKHKDYRREYTDKTKKLVADFYAEEIEQFGFTFE